MLNKYVMFLFYDFQNAFDKVPHQGLLEIVTISADVKVSEQCGIVASKGNQSLGLIRRQES